MDDCINLIKKHEGLRLRPYKCSVGKVTIGYGRNLEDCGISEEEAETLLINDVYQVTDELNDNFDFFQYLPDTAKNVLTNMCFNLGIARLKGFRKFLAAVELEDWESASIEMMDSKWARQVGPRAIELRDMMLSLK